MKGNCGGMLSYKNHLWAGVQGAVLNVSSILLKKEEKAIVFLKLPRLGCIIGITVQVLTGTQ